MKAKPHVWQLGTFWDDAGIMHQRWICLGGGSAGYGLSQRLAYEDWAMRRVVA